jgi:hypothetical protein
MRRYFLRGLVSKKKAENQEIPNALRLTVRVGTQIDSSFPDLTYNSDAILASKRIFNHVMCIRILKRRMRERAIRDYRKRRAPKPSGSFNVNLTYPQSKHALRIEDSG